MEPLPFVSHTASKCPKVVPKILYSLSRLLSHNLVVEKHGDNPIGRSWL